MAKISKRLTVKGFIDYDNGEVVEFDKDLGEIRHSFDDIFEDITLTLAHDKVVEGEVKDQE